jgi:hypothetical protein
MMGKSSKWTGEAEKVDAPVVERISADELAYHTKLMEARTRAEQGFASAEQVLAKIRFACDLWWAHLADKREMGLDDQVDGEGVIIRAPKPEEAPIATPVMDAPATIDAPAE